MSNTYNNNHNLNNHNKITNHHNHHHHHIVPSQTTTSNRSTSSTRSHSSIVSTTRSNSTTQACAACRYQRRKCAPDCILAPYFPHDRQRQFQNAHKLFGVSNITKIIKDLDPVKKEEAMRTIIYQSDVRAHDPVGGCYRIIHELQRQIDYSRAELEIVSHQLAIYRAHAMQTQNQNINQNQIQNQNLNQNQLHHHHDQILIDGVDCGIHLVTNHDDPNLYQNGLDLDLGQITPQQEHKVHDHETYILANEHNLNENHHDGCQDDDNVVQIQEINSWANMNNSPSSTICLEVNKPPVDECDDFKPLLINDDIPEGERHEFKFEFDDINEPSEETLFNEANDKSLTKEENVAFYTKEENVVTYQHQHNEDHDLKGAATLFTLTNCSTY